MAAPIEIDSSDTGLVSPPPLPEPRDPPGEANDESATEEAPVPPADTETPDTVWNAPKVRDGGTGIVQASMSVPVSRTQAIQPSRKAQLDQPIKRAGEGAESQESRSMIKGQRVSRRVIQ